MKDYKRIKQAGICVVVTVLMLFVGMKGNETDTFSLDKQAVDGTELTAQRDTATEEIIETEETVTEETTEIPETEEVVVETEEQETESEVEDTEQYESEYANFAIANVTDYVNVRNLPSTDGEVVGKIFDGAVAEILSVAGEEDDWFEITSGNVEGYIKAEFFIHGEEAAAVMDRYVVKYALVEADRLNVREGQSTDHKRIGYLNNGEKVKVLEDCGEWFRIQYTGQKEGYVSAQYVMILEEYTYAKTLSEEQEEIAIRKEREARSGSNNQEQLSMSTNVAFPATNYTSNEELRKNIVDYALQFVGNRYVNGGSSLTSGTDCSGFTCFIYADFGYSISRTPEGQFSSAGRSIDYSEIQPGDIICFSSNGGASCTHVALYIGDGQIVHAANSRTGVVTSGANFEPIIGIKNVID